MVGPRDGESLLALLGSNEDQREKTRRVAQTDGGCISQKLFTHDKVSGVFVASDVRGPRDQNAFELP